MRLCPSVRRSVGPALYSKVKSTHTRRILCRVSALFLKSNAYVIFGRTQNTLYLKMYYDFSPSTLLPNFATQTHLPWLLHITPSMTLHPYHSIHAIPLPLKDDRRRNEFPFRRFEDWESSGQWPRCWPFLHSGLSMVPWSLFFWLPQLLQNIDQWKTQWIKFPSIEIINSFYFWLLRAALLKSRFWRF